MFEKNKRLIFAICTILFLFAAGMVIVAVRPFAVRITEVTPSIVTADSTIIIRGRNFGRQRGRGFVAVNYQFLAQDAYLEWNRNEVRVTLPSQIRSGLLRLHTNGGRNTSSFITGWDNLPNNTENNTRLVVKKVEPQSVSVGEVLTISGIFHHPASLQLYMSRQVIDDSTTGSTTGDDGSGAAADVRQNNGRVTAGDSSDNSGATSELFPLAASDYLERTSDMLSVRIPTGASTGAIAMYDAHDGAWHGSIDIDTRYGYQRYTVPQEYAVQIGVHTERPPQQEIMVWLPVPQLSAAQPVNASLYQSHPSQFFTDTAALYRLTAEHAPRQDIRVTYQVRSYAVESVISSSPPISGVQAEWLQTWLRPAEHLAVDSDRAVEVIRDSVRGQSLLQRARAIYQVVQDNLVLISDYDFSETQTDAAVNVGSPDISALLTDTSNAAAPEYSPVPTAPAAEILPNRIDIESILLTIGVGPNRAVTAREYALTTVTLLRTAGIPARVITGLYFPYISDNDDSVPVVQRIEPHYWAEFYLPEIGWIPMDPALARTERSAGGQETQPRDYFGKLDSAHIQLGSGLTEFPAINQNNTQAFFTRSYSLFSNHVEYQPIIEGSDVTVYGYWFPIYGIYTKL